jgi:hypothetical protein
MYGEIGIEIDEQTNLNDLKNIVYKKDLPSEVEYIDDSQQIDIESVLKNDDLPDRLKQDLNDLGYL